MMSHLTLNKSLISFAFAHRLNIKESMDDAITHAQHNGSLYRICHRYLDMYSVDKCLAEI